MSAFDRLYHAEHDKNPVFDDRFAKELMSGGESMKKDFAKHNNKKKTACRRKSTGGGFYLIKYKN